MPRLQRGAGRVFVDRIPYVIDAAMKRLAHLERVVLVNAKAPVAFFAYPDKPSLLLPPACEVLELAGPAEDGIDAIERLADALDARSREPVREPLALPDAADRRHHARRPGGGRLRPFFPKTPSSWTSPSPQVADSSLRRAPPVRTTGSRTRVGRLARVCRWPVGAAVACPDRKVVCLESDGSGMYTLQGLWTMAREQLDVTVVLFNNRSYEILKGEFKYVGAGEAGAKATDMLEIGRPDLDWVALAERPGCAGREGPDAGSARQRAEGRARRTRTAACRGDAVECRYDGAAALARPRQMPSL